MAKAKTTTYKCTQCGTRLVVSESLEAHLSPIYCCGTEVTEVSTIGKKPAKPEKTLAKKGPKVIAKGKVTKKKNPAVKKKPSKK